MLKGYTSFVAVLLLCVACSRNALEQASASYKTRHDHASLVIIFKALRKGLHKSHVDELLGGPDYSPTQGQYYYSSDRRERVEGNPNSVSVGLVLDYRKNDQGTDILEEFWLGPIGE